MECISPASPSSTQHHHAGTDTIKHKVKESSSEDSSRMPCGHGKTQQPQTHVLRICDPEAQTQCFHMLSLHVLSTTLKKKNSMGTMPTLTFT